MCLGPCKKSRAPASVAGEGTDNGHHGTDVDLTHDCCLHPYWCPPRSAGPAGKRQGWGKSPTSWSPQRKAGLAGCTDSLPLSTCTPHVHSQHSDRVLKAHHADPTHTLSPQVGSRCELALCLVPWPASRAKDGWVTLLSEAPRGFCGVGVNQEGHAEGPRRAKPPSAGPQQQIQVWP